MVYCQLVSEMPHVLKTLTSVKWRMFDSRVFLSFMQDPGKTEGPQRFLGLEVVSRLQKVEDAISGLLNCKIIPGPFSLLHISEMRCLPFLIKITKAKDFGHG